jgi:hypothetical protein
VTVRQTPAFLDQMIAVARREMIAVARRDTPGTEQPAHPIGADVKVTDRARACSDPVVTVIGYFPPYDGTPCYVVRTSGGEDVLFAYELEAPR